MSTATRPIVKEFAVKHRGIFTIGDEEHECELEGWLACELDGGVVDNLRPLSEQTALRFMPIICGVEMLGVLVGAQRELFARCFETHLGRERLRVLCKTANGEQP